MPWIIYLYRRDGRACYTGQTEKSPAERAGKNGCQYSKQIFGRAIAKYGWDTFQCEELCVCNTQEEANDVEKKMIIKHKTHFSEGGYNISWGGRSPDNPSSYSKEHKAKFSATVTKAWQTWREKQGVVAGVSKRCCRCKEVKNLGEFHKSCGTFDGLRSTCKKCSSYYKRKYREQRTEAQIGMERAKQKVRNRRYRLKHIKEVKIGELTHAEACKNDERLARYKNQLGMMLEDTLYVM